MSHCFVSAGTASISFEQLAEFTLKFLTRCYFLHRSRIDMMQFFPVSSIIDCVRHVVVSLYHRHFGSSSSNCNTNKEHLTCCTFAQEVGSGKLSYLTLHSDCVGSRTRGKIKSDSDSHRKDSAQLFLVQQSNGCPLSLPSSPPPPTHTHTQTV